MRENQAIYKSTQDRILCGVCGGLAEHWQISSLWLRLSIFVALFVGFPLIIPIYFVLCFLMANAPQEGSSMARWHHLQDSVPPPPPGAGGAPQRRFRTTKEAREILADTFENMEKRIQSLEDVVTSKAWQLQQKFKSIL